MFFEAKSESSLLWFADFEKSAFVRPERQLTLSLIRRRARDKNRPAPTHDIVADPDP
jgi:hypothetical protein